MLPLYSPFDPDDSCLIACGISKSTSSYPLCLGVHPCIDNMCTIGPGLKPKRGMSEKVQACKSDMPLSTGTANCVGIGSRYLGPAYLAETDPFELPLDFAQILFKASGYILPSGVEHGTTTSFPNTLLLNHSCREHIEGGKEKRFPAKNVKSSKPATEKIIRPLRRAEKPNYVKLLCARCA